MAMPLLPTPQNKINWVPLNEKESTFVPSHAMGNKLIHYAAISIGCQYPLRNTNIRPKKNCTHNQAMAEPEF